jgi:hypothetical protein
LLTLSSCKVHFHGFKAFNAIHKYLRFGPQTCDLVSASPLEDGPAWAEGLVCHERSQDRSDRQDRGLELLQSTLRSTHVEMIGDDHPCGYPARHFVSSLSQPGRTLHVPTAAATPDHPDSEVTNVRSSHSSPDHELATFYHISDNPSAAPTSDSNSNAHIHQRRQSTLLRQPSPTRISSHNNCIQPYNTVKLLADWRGASVILLRLDPTVPLTGCYILGCHPFQTGKAQFPTTMSKMTVPPDLRIYCGRASWPLAPYGHRNCLLSIY